MSMAEVLRLQKEQTARDAIEKLAPSALANYSAQYVRLTETLSRLQEERGRLGAMLRMQLDARDKHSLLVIDPGIGTIYRLVTDTSRDTVRVADDVEIAN